MQRDGEFDEYVVSGGLMRFTDENVELLTEHVARDIESLDIKQASVDEAMRYIENSLKQGMRLLNRPRGRSADLTLRERRMSVRRQKISLLRRLRVKFDEDNLGADAYPSRVRVSRIVNRRHGFEYIIDVWLPKPIAHITVPMESICQTPAK